MALGSTVTIHGIPIATMQPEEVNDVRKTHRTGERNMNINEAIGIGYPLIATTLFTAALVYFSIKGLTYTNRLIRRGRAEENVDLQRSESIRRELAKVQ
jgi:hypothetical protein